VKGRLAVSGRYLQRHDPRLLRLVVVGVVIVLAIALMVFLLKRDDVDRSKKNAKNRACNGGAQRIVTIQPSEWRTIGGWMCVRAVNRCGET